MNATHIYVEYGIMISFNLLYVYDQSWSSIDVGVYYVSDFSIQSSVLDTGVSRGEKRNARRRFGAALFHLQIFLARFFSLYECCGVLYVHVLYNSTKSIFTFFLFPFSAYISLTFSFYNLRFFTLNNEIFNVFSFSWNSADSA